MRYSDSKVNKKYTGSFFSGLFHSIIQAHTQFNCFVVLIVVVVWLSSVILVVVVLVDVVVVIVRAKSANFNITMMYCYQLRVGLI